MKISASPTRRRASVVGPRSTAGAGCAADCVAYGRGAEKGDVGRGGGAGSSAPRGATAGPMAVGIFGALGIAGFSALPRAGVGARTADAAGAAGAAGGSRVGGLQVEDHVLFDHDDVVVGVFEDLLGGERGDLVVLRARRDGRRGPRRAAAGVAHGLRALRRAQGVAGLLVVGRELQHALVGRRAVFEPRGLAVNARDLLEHRDGLRQLPELAKRGAEELQGVDVAGVVLVRDLELGQRALGVAAIEVERRQALREVHVAAAVKEQALGDARPVLGPARAVEEAARRLELRGGLLTAVGLREQLREANARAHAAAVDLDHPAVDAHQGLVVLGAGVALREGVEVLHRVRPQAQLHVQLGELEVELHQVGVDLEDLLVDRDGLEEEALLVVRDGDAGVGLDGRLPRVHAHLQVADLQEDADVRGVLAEHPLVLHDGAVELVLRGVFLRGVDDLLTIDAHE